VTGAWQGSKARGRCPLDPRWGLEAPNPRQFCRVFRRRAKEALTKGEPAPLLNTLQDSRGSGALGPSGVKGQSPLPYFFAASGAGKGSGEWDRVCR
jgi:hypothetical protein